LLVACRAVVSQSFLAQWPSHRAPSEGTRLQMCVLMFKNSLALMKKLLTCLPRLACAVLNLHRTCGRDLPKPSQCPHGRLTFCSLFAGRWCHCRGQSNLVIVHHHWEYSWRCACSSLKFPMVSMGNLRFCLFFAGRRCLCLGWHGDLVIVRHHWQHSYLCACSHSKSPIAPMGTWLTCLPRLTLAQLRTLRSTSGGACHRDLEDSHHPHGSLADMPQSTLLFGLIFGSTRHMYVPATPANFPSPRWDFHIVCACAFRAAVFTSVVAR
jgi:hypothetical protein